MDLMVYCHDLSIILIAAAVSYCFFTLGNYIRTQKTINDTLFKGIFSLCDEVDKLKEKKDVTVVEEDYAKQEIIKMYTLPSEKSTVMSVEAKILPFKKPSDINFS